MVRYLIKKGAVVDGQRSTFAHWYSSGPLRRPLSVDDGFTALHAACRQGLVDVLSVLLEAGADPNSRAALPVRGSGPSLITAWLIPVEMRRAPDSYGSRLESSAQWCAAAPGGRRS